MEKDSIGMELRSLNNLIRRYFEFSSHKREIESVTGNNGWIIGYLAENADQDIFQKDIEDYFTITKSTASKVLSLMERKGLIQRQSVERDARLKKLVLTKKAWDISKTMRQDSEAFEKKLMSGFSQGEIDKLISYIRRMKGNISVSQEVG